MARVTVRAAEERDLERAGDVNFLAFYDVALRHGQRPTVAAPAEARSYLRYLAGVDPLGGLVAEEDGEIVGVAWAHARGPVTTIGPVAVHPQAQGRGVGRLLLGRALEAAGGGQVRLVHESFNAISLGLYLRAGFRVVAPLIELVRPAEATGAAVAPAGVRIRAAVADDRLRLIARDARAFGAPRPQSLDPYLRRGRVLVADDGRALAGYACGIGVRATAYLGSAAADDGEVLLALVGTLTAELAGAAVHVLVPAADRLLLDGLAGLGYRVLRACQYMVLGGGTAPPPSYVLMNGDMM
ncbi:MAG TPA: GNAT family N-acetyltransferase [Candidatus Binatia bacterium]|nr:GNAT family N-acetyltransferase [Candidatus Binatia bacterium]